PGDQPGDQPGNQPSGHSATRNLQPAIVEEPPQDKLRYGNSRSDMSESIVTIGYHTPALKADKEGLKEAATLQMMAAVLGLGQGSRLWQGLRRGRLRATRPESFSKSRRIICRCPAPECSSRACALILAGSIAPKPNISARSNGSAAS